MENGVMPILVDLHHIGALPLPELQRRHTKRAVASARTRALIEPFTDETGGTLYVVTGKGRPYLKLTDSRNLSPHVVSESFIRQVAHSYLEAEGYFYVQPKGSNALTRSYIREYWTGCTGAPQFPVLAALPHPGATTVNRVVFGHRENVWVFAESREPYAHLAKNAFFDPDYINLIPWRNVWPKLSPSMQAAFDRHRRNKRLELFSQ